MLHVPPVPAALRRHVVARTPYDVDFGASGVHRGLPSTSLTLVLAFGEPLRVSWLDQPATLRTDWGSLSGLHTGPAAIHHDGTQRGVQLALTLQGARALLNQPAADLSGELTDLDQAAVPRALQELPERLHDVRTWTARVALIDRTLTTLAVRTPVSEPPAEIAHALDLLAAGTRVAEVAAAVGYSRHRLATLVRSECGLTPKSYQRVARFEAARTLLGRRPLAEVATVTGYADQAHFTREWAGLAGCTPTTWLREEFPFVQDRVEGEEAASEL